MVLAVGKPGFQPPRKTYVLDFEGTDLDGLTVKARGASLGQFLALGQLAEDADQAEGAAGESAAISAMLALFDELLVEWNLDDENGVRIPATAEGMATLDPSQVMAIIGAWQRAVAAVPVPLKDASTGGSPSVVRSMPMEPLSPSLAS